MPGTFVARKTASRASSNAEVAAATNLAGEVREVPWVLQQGLQGNIYIAGHGLEEGAVTGTADTLDETTPTFMLMAPASGTIVVPIHAEFRMHADGGGASAAYLSYVGVDRSSAPAYTNLDKLQICGAATQSKAIAGRTISSVTAITSAQTVLLARRANILDAIIATEMATGEENQETFAKDSLGLEFNFWKKFGGAFQLYGGRSIMFHAMTGTTGATYTCTFVWAEIPSSTYDHIA